MLGVLAVGAGVLLSRARPTPRIAEVVPAVAEPGQAVSVIGSGFGEGGRIEIDGIAIPIESVRNWRDALIVFTLPERARSGLLRVQTTHGMSNGLFVTNAGTLPARGGEGTVAILSVRPETLVTGLPVTVTGRGFGPRTPDATIAFGTGATLRATDPLVARWLPEQIDLLAPPALPAGPSELSIRGTVAATFVGGNGTAGVVVGAATEHRVTHRLIVGGEPPANRDGTPVGAVSMAGAALPWSGDRAGAIAVIATDASEGSARFHTDAIQRVRTVAVERGLSRDVALPGAVAVEPDGDGRVVVTVVVERHPVAVEIASVAPSVVQSILADPRFVEVMSPWLGESRDVPLAPFAAIRRQRVDTAALVEPRARAVYETVIDLLEPSRYGTDDPVVALTQGIEATPRAYATLAAALARGSGVPAARVFGVRRAPDGSTLDHAWVELFLPGTGWFPIDPAEADERGVDRFGQLDADRIAIARDAGVAPTVFPVGRRVSATRAYPLDSAAVEVPLSRDAPSVRWVFPEFLPAN